MKRHEAVQLSKFQGRGKPWLKPKCSCGEEFQSACDLWHHQAAEYERLMNHYSHLFEPVK